MREIEMRGNINSNTRNPKVVGSNLTPLTNISSISATQT